MAELTKQQSIKLLSINKFRISAVSTARSRNLTARQTDKKSSSFVLENRYGESVKSKYPQSNNFKKALQKIGALQKEDLRFTFEPDEQDYKIFRTRRINSLKLKYFKQRVVQDNSGPYNDEQIDEAALGCWNYGQNVSQKSVWRKYRDNLNSLNFDTLKLISKKKVY